MRYSDSPAQVSELYLFAELDYTPALDEHDPGDGDPFAWYVDLIQKRMPDEWAADAVGISWTVMPAMEFAPFSGNADIDFLTFYSWPVDVVTDEPLDWLRLPVRMDRFPDFEKAIGWKPSPMQKTAPVRSIWDSRRADKFGRRLELLQARRRETNERYPHSPNREPVR